MTIDRQDPQDGAPRLYATARGPIECAIAGDGPALLATHGGMGGHDQSLLLARSVLADAATMRVVAVSRPGYLGTPLASGRSAEEHADLYAALLDTLGIERAVLVAVSAGGPSAIAFAQRHPGRCRALILVSCCTGPLPIPPEVARRFPMMKLFAALPGVAALMRWRTRRDLPAAARRSIHDEATLERTLDDPQAGPLFAALLLGTFSQMKRRIPGTESEMARFAALPERLAPLAVPTLVIHGTADAVVPVSHAWRVLDATPGAARLIVEGGEHVTLFTHLDAVRAKVAAFLAANGQRNSRKSV